MTKKILIDAKYLNEIRAVLVNKNNIIEELECETADKQQIKGNIYLAKIARIEPSLQAAFITYENGNSGFLPFAEIHPDFFTLITEEKNQANIENMPEIQIPKTSSPDLEEPNQAVATITLDEEFDINALVSKDLEKNAIKVDFESVCDDVEDIKTQYESLYKKYKIQDVIKKGQIIVVQAQKEQRGNKAASFTTFLSLAGKFCVLMPNTPKQSGISRRIINQEERKRLKSIVANITAEEQANTSSIIVRTAGIDRTSTEIQKDYEYLIRTWNKIRSSAIKSIAPIALHIEEEIIPKTIRDMLDDKVGEVIIQGHASYEQAVEFVKQILPNEISKIVEHTDLEPIFTKFGIEEQILNLYQPIVPLPSGGYIVINPTEALTSIDVNSGKATNEKHIEETALKTNAEAAMQIAKQIKLRDISGLIVVDFIDMHEGRNRKILEHTFKEHLSLDKAKIYVNPISNLGLVEISRQRLSPSFLERNSAGCQYCNGKGVVRSDEANAILILRTIAAELATAKLNKINVFAHVDSILYILNRKRKEIEEIQVEFSVELNFYQDKNATAESFYIEKIKLQQSTRKEAPKPKAFKEKDVVEDQNISVKAQHIEETVDAGEQEASEEVGRRKTFRRRRKFANKPANNQKQEVFSNLGE
jgi:ribonuclease E